MNLAALTKRIEALEEKRGQEGMTDLLRYRGKWRRVVNRIIDEVKIVRSELQERGKILKKDYAGPITEDMLVITNTIVHPIIPLAWNDDDPISTVKN